MRITIGLPFFNSAATLADAIRSVFAQTLDDWELILVDDGSQDESAQIARAVIDDRVRFVSGGENRGLPYRLNQIAQLARSEYIARFDADDLMHPARLERQVARLEGDRDLDLVGTGMYTIDSASRAVGKRGCDRMPVSAEAILRGRSIAHPTVTGRTSWFRANPYDPRYRRSQDCELWCRSFAERRFRVEVIAEPLYFFREEGSVTVSKILEGYRMQRMLVRRYGSALVGWRRSLVMTGTLCAKALVYRAAAVIGREMSLVNRRNKPLAEEERSSASQTLQSILGSVVPGLTLPCGAASQ